MELRIDGKFCNECYHSRRAAVVGPSDSARRAAEEILEWLNFDTSLDAAQADVYGVWAIISKNFAVAPAQKSPIERQEWRQGMRDAAKEVCDACADEYRYGRARKIDGSTRWWHGEHADFQCEAGSIWHALEASAAAPADNDAELGCTCDDLTEVQRAQGDHYDDCPRAKGDH